MGGSYVVPCALRRLYARPAACLELVGVCLSPVSGALLTGYYVDPAFSNRWAGGGVLVEQQRPGGHPVLHPLEHQGGPDAFCAGRRAE